MIEVLRLVPGTDPASRSPAVFRPGLRAARQELRAGSARRLHTVADLDPARPAGWSMPTPSAPVARPSAAGSAAAEPVGTDDAELATQRAGVRAALDELRQHRGHR